MGLVVVIVLVVLVVLLVLVVLMVLLVLLVLVVLVVLVVLTDGSCGCHSSRSRGWITHRFWETSLDSLQENRLDKMPTRSATKT